jgi:tetratricopeptide (TPR) repeat protein
MLKVVSQTIIILIFSFLWFPEVFGQPTLPSDLKKPKKYENKLLGAEKSAEKKFRGSRKFIQNTVTHYNWYFNANNKLNQIIESAKLAHKDDFTKLLPFYNYSLDVTSASKTELDSVIYKANTGVLIHDLRNYWIDNLYMLIGKSYFFRNQLDSAYLTFQYINYAFSPKEADGYDMPIGSNANEGTNALSVSTKEKSSIIRNALTTQPSRNESFIWQIRTYMERDMMPEAASLIQTLKNDPLFPERLYTSLNEMQAYWFYKQKMYDSAAAYLEQALPNANDRIESSRWEYLIGQLYERAKKPEMAIKFYDRARKHTLDPILEVHAILNSIRQDKSDSVAIQNNIDELKKMGRRDKYQNYQDIIYYTAAQIELERNNREGAKELLFKSAKNANILNPSQRTASFLLLGDIYFEESNFPQAKRYYDSVNNNDPGLIDPIAFDKRKEILNGLVAQIDIIHRQDSLQQLASMPEAERNAFLKKKVRQLRKQQGLKEEEFSVNAAIGMNNNNSSKPPPDLFDNNAKGDWYFNNPSLKSKGFTSFKQVWGNRPNTDNWRRAAAVTAAVSASRTPQPGGAGRLSAPAQETEEDGLTVAGLLKGIPLTPDKLQVSEDSIAEAMLEMGIIYVDKLEQYNNAIDTLEKFIDKYTYHSRKQEGLYYLYIAYQKTGNTTKANLAKSELDKKYQGTKQQQLIDNSITGETGKHKKQVTDDYNKVYNLFIEGDFTSALRQKKINDSLYGTSYWTPQLLYIEAVYHLQKRNDEDAKRVLNNIIGTFPSDPMAKKAQNILDVLSRRKEIEDYLTKLEIKRVEDTVFIAKAPPKPREQIGTPMEQDTTRMLPMKKPVLLKDTVKTGKPVITAPNIVIKQDTTRSAPESVFTFNVESAHAVAVVLTKVDPVYVTESKNAFNRYNQEKFYNRKIDINNITINDTLKLVLMTGFENAAVALEYLQKTQPVAATQIVPWLPVAKYSMIIISEHNAEVLKNNQDMNGYKKFMERYFTK